MAGYNTVVSTDLDELIPLILGEARMWFAEQSLFFPKKGVAQDLIQWADLTNEPGNTATFPKYAAIAFGDATEGVDYTDTQDLNTNAGLASITAYEKVVVVPIADRATRAVTGGKQKLVTDLGRMVGLAASIKFDGDVMALFSGLGTCPYGTTTGQNMAVNNFEGYIASLRSAKAPDPYGAFFSPLGWMKFLQADTFGGGSTVSPLAIAAVSDQVAKDIWQSFYTDNIMGVRCFQHADVPTANGGADYMGAFMSAWAIGCTWKMDLQIEQQRDASLRATEFVATMEYGVGVIDSTMGYKMLQDKPSLGS